MFMLKCFVSFKLFNVQMSSVQCSNVLLVLPRAGIRYFFGTDGIGIRYLKTGHSVSVLRYFPKTGHSVSVSVSVFQCFKKNL